MRRSRAVALLGLAALLSLSACVSLGEQELEFVHTEPAKISEIAVNGGSGDVTVRTGEVSSVEIRRTVRYRGDQPGATHRVDGATLTLDTGCGRGCSVSYDVLAPTGVAVTGRNGSGDLTLTGVSTVRVRVGSGSIRVTRASGAVEATTGSGEIRVSGVDGETRLKAGSGDIDGDGLGGGALTVDSGSGDIRLSLDRATAVRAKTGSGSIDLTVPAGGYRVQTRTGSGSVAVHVTDDPNAPHPLELTTASGDITVRPR